MIAAALDANIFISYLLARDRSATIQLCVESGLAGEFTLVVAQPLLDELARKISEKPYLAARIPQADLTRLIAVLSLVGVMIPPSEEPIPSVSRDDKDDYVLAYAKIADADYLVTGDKDLLVLRNLIDRPAIRTPAEFVRELGLDVTDDAPGESNKPEETGEEAI